MATGSSRSTADPMSFLQTLVDPQKGVSEKTDSDKENESGLMTITEEEASETDSKLNVTSNVDHNDNKMWDDFYNEDEFIVKKNKPPSLFNTTHSEMVSYPNFESPEDAVNKEQEEEDDCQSKTQADDITVSAGCIQSPRSSSAKRKRKRLFKKREQPVPSPVVAPTVNGGSHPNLGRQNYYDRRSSQQDTMSESSRRGSRRLSRRKQVARPRCAGPEPTGDRLEEKYRVRHYLNLRKIAI